MHRVWIHQAFLYWMNWYPVDPSPPSSALLIFFCGCGSGLG
jgi:hypothetical protein